MKTLEQELAELEAAIAELRAAIAAPLRELAVLALLVLTSRRALAIALLVAVALGSFGWFALELWRALAN